MYIFLFQSIDTIFNTLTKSTYKNFKLKKVNLNFLLGVCVQIFPFDYKLLAFNKLSYCCTL